jgi:hypothetical protein
MYIPSDQNIHGIIIDHYALSPHSFIPRRPLPSIYAPLAPTNEPILPLDRQNQRKYAPIIYKRKPAP